MGSLSDPKETPGLAHFCEHMLFYASAKYPEEDAYSKFVVSSAISEALMMASQRQKYEGRANKAAHTASAHTPPWLRMISPKQAIWLSLQLRCCAWRL